MKNSGSFDEGIVDIGAAKGILPFWYAVLLVLAAAVLSVIYALAAPRFDYQNAWVSAHYGVMAEMVARHGILGLGGVPLQNYEPITTEPDVYLNWPPLFVYALAAAFKLFGATERVAHLFMIAVQFSSAGLVYLMSRRLLSSTAALVATATFLALPITAKHGFLVSNVNFAIMLSLASIATGLAHLDEARAGRSGRWQLGVSAVACFAAVYTTWEPVLMVPGLLAAALFLRDGAVFRLAVVLGIAGLAGLLATFGWFGLQHPYFFEQIWSRFWYRVGVIDYTPELTRVHALGELGTKQGNRLLMFERRFLLRLDLLTSLGVILMAMATFCVVFVRSWPARRLALAALFALYAMWLGWAALMRNHFTAHEFQTLYAAPIVAIAAGILADYLAMVAERLDLPLRKVLIVAAVVLVPVGFLVPSVNVQLNRFSNEPPEGPNMQFGRLIGSVTEPNAIVLSTDLSIVPIFYAKRHLIRGIVDESVVIKHWQQIRDLCHECPFYVAIEPGKLDRFAGLARRFPVAGTSSVGIVLRLGAMDAPPS